MSVVTSHQHWGSSTPVDPYQQYYDDSYLDDKLLVDDDDEGRSASPFISAFLISSFINAGLMVLLATIFFDPPPEPIQIIASASFEEEEQIDDKESPIQIFRFTKEELPETGSPSVVGIEVPVSSANQVSEVTSLRTEERPVELAKLEAPISVDISAAPNFTHDVRIKGNAGVGAVGAIGAVDRITQEILLSLEERPTLVVWFFDKSWSMLPQRKEINQRFEKVYREVGVSHLVATNHDELPLLTSVVSFGAEYEYRHPNGVHKARPMLTNQLSEIQAAVASIENDPSGVESTFSSIIDAAGKLRVFRHGNVKRNIMFVVFTDEVGDDEQRLEEAVAVCRNNAIRVYVVGTPAPFGRRNIEFKYVDPDPNYDQSVQWLPVRAGPETMRPEMVNLGFSGFTSRDSTIYRLDSGFGPFALTRLAYETGGIFFSVHPARPLDAAGFVPRSETPPMSPAITHFYDPMVMRPYAPNYVPEQEYLRLLRQNRAKEALVIAAEKAMVLPMDNPTLRFTRNPENEAALKQQLDEAQKKAALLEPRINDVYQTLKQGDPDRSKLTEPRWQAGFDLAMGRVLAVKVRTEGYNLILAKAKFGLKLNDPKSNRLELKPSDEVTVGSVHQKMAKLSTELLEGVIRDHAGTPWAYLAAEELKQPMGWKWVDHYQAEAPPAKNTTRPAVGGGGGNRPRPAIPKNADPKPIRQGVKL